MPPARPTHPPAAPKQPWPRPHLPSLIPAVGLVLFLSALSVVGIQYELKPPSDFNPKNVIYEVTSENRAGELRDAASRLRSVATAWDAKAFDTLTTDSQAKVLKTRAATFSARADSLEAQANVATRCSPAATRSASSGFTRGQSTSPCVLSR